VEEQRVEREAFRAGRILRDLAQQRLDLLAPDAGWRRVAAAGAAEEMRPGRRLREDHRLRHDDAEIGARGRSVVRAAGGDGERRGGEKSFLHRITPAYRGSPASCWSSRTCFTASLPATCFQTPSQ